MSQTTGAQAVVSGPDQIFEILFGFANTQILLASDELNVFDALADKPLSAEQAGAALGLKAELIGRLLTGCASLGLMVKDGGTYALIESSRRHLVKTSPQYVGRGFDHFNRDLYPLWSNLAAAVKEGQPQWGKVPGMDPQGPFESMYQEEAHVRQFMETMFTMTYPSALEYAERFDFSRYSHIVDLGGASGAFFAGVLPGFTEVRGTIFDLPPVESSARECMAKFGLTDRVDFIGGDFFNDALPQPADMYVLGFILHDWNYEQGTQLLKKIYDFLPPHGAVFICEGLFNEQKDGPHMTSVMDLNMLVATYGQERTPNEYKNWLIEAGFARAEHQYCEGPKSFVVGYKQ